MKRILAFCLAVCMLAAAIIQTFAEETRGLLVLGDSISTGYALPGYTQGKDNHEVMSFGNMLAEFLGYPKDGVSYKSLAVDGMTTTGLLNLILKSPEETEGYDYIAISIGGNDLIDSLMPAVISAISQLYGKEEGLAEILKKISAFKSKINGTIQTSGENAAQNIDEILKTVRERNPNSFIAIQTVYNPFTILDENRYFAPVNGALISPVINSLNQSIISSAKKYGVYVLDTAKVFDPQPKIYTNIAKADIHPSVEGHMRIFQLLQSAISHFKQRRGD